MIIEQKDKFIISFSRDENNQRKISRCGNFLSYFYYGIEEEIIKDGRILKVEKSEKVENAEVEKVKTVSPINPNAMVKKIYFPGDVYSKNQNEFKKILANYGLSWIKGMMKSYVSKEGIKLLTGMYGSADQSKKVFCIYEGTNKPMTAIIKVIGTGGNFLIDIISFSNRVGCIIEDKDDIYSNNVILTLHEKGEIYVEKKIEDEKIEDYEKIFEEKVQKYIDDRLKEYLDAYKESFEQRGISINTVIFFKRKEIEEDVRRGIENGLIKL